MSEALTEAELRELAEAGDEDAAEELARLDGSYEEYIAERDAEIKADLAYIDSLDGPDDEAVQLVDGGRDYDEDELDDAEYEELADGPYHPRAGDAVLVGGAPSGVVRVAHGRGVVTLEDGRQLTGDKYTRGA